MCSLVYLASPYTHEDSKVMESRFVDTQRACAVLLSFKIPVFSPTVYAHPMAVDYELPRDFNFWGEFNKSVLEGATDLIILQLPGWEKSIGIKGEMKFFNSLADGWYTDGFAREIYYVNMDEIKAWHRDGICGSFR